MFMKDYILKKEKLVCPFCEEEREMEVKKIKQIEKVKNLDVEYEAVVYYCSECDEYFESGEMMESNLRALRDAYRVKMGLLTTEEIVAIRDKYRISQEDFAIILGFGEKTIARYETSAIQDKPYDDLMRLFDKDYNFAYEQVQNAKDKLSNKKFEQISNSIKGFIYLESQKIDNEKMLSNQYIMMDEPNSSNGFTLLNIDKIKSMMAFFAKFTKNLFTVKLMKLFWYSDALSYQRTGKAISGLVYKHMPMGALPVGYKEICDLDSVNREHFEIHESISTQFLPKDTDEINESLFTLDELRVLNDVCKKFENASGSELSDIMHEEKVYQVTEPNEILHFLLIEKLKCFE